jgi:hypothetical protein
VTLAGDDDQERKGSLLVHPSSVHSLLRRTNLSSGWIVAVGVLLAGESSSQRSDRATVTPAGVTGFDVAFMCSGVVLPAVELPEECSAIPLDGGMAFIHSPARDAGPAKGLDHLDWAEQIAQAVASGVRVIYIEAEFFGGTGNQAAVGWQGGVLSFGPRRTQMPMEDREGYAVVGDQDDMAINAALRWLGIRRTQMRDEFDTVGIGRCAIP